MPRDTIPAFAAAVRERLAALGISQNKLAREAGVSKSAIEKIVTGDRHRRSAWP